MAGVRAVIAATAHGLGVTLLVTSWAPGCGGAAAGSEATREPLLPAVSPIPPPASASNSARAQAPCHGEGTAAEPADVTVRGLVDDPWRRAGQWIRLSGVVADLSSMCALIRCEGRCCAPCGGDVTVREPENSDLTAVSTKRFVRVRDRRFQVWRCSGSDCERACMPYPAGTAVTLTGVWRAVESEGGGYPHLEVVHATATSGTAWLTSRPWPDESDLSADAEVRP